MEFVRHQNRDKPFPPRVKAPQYWEDPDLQQGQSLSGLQIRGTADLMNELPGTKWIREIDVMAYLGRLLRNLVLHPVASIVCVLLLIVIGIAAHSAAWQIWAEVQYRKALRAIDRRDFGAAQTALERCLGVRDTSADLHFLAARTARRVGNYDDSERHLRDSKRHGELAEAIDLERMLVQAQRGDLGRIEGPLLYLATENHHDAGYILEALAWAYIKTFQLPRAQHVLSLWLDREPDNVQALLWLGEVQERRLNFQDALTTFRQAVKAAPERDDARQHLADMLLQTHQPEEADIYLRDLATRRPQDAALLFGQARARHLMKELDEARELLDQILQAQPNHQEALAERGRILLEKGELSEAEKSLRRAWELAPYDRETTYALYLCLSQLGKRDVASTMLGKLETIEKQLQRLVEVTRQIGDTPHDPAPRLEAGMIFLKTGQVKEGLRWLNSALQEDPRHGPTHEALASYYQSSGNSAQAAEHRRWAGLATAGPLSVSAAAQPH
jgi:tetratricopeptide (TPR) repeat protein